MTAIEFCSQLLSLEHSLLNFEYRLKFKRTDAKDLVQETYQRVLMSRDKYADNINLKSININVPSSGAL